MHSNTYPSMFALHGASAQALNQVIVWSDRGQSNVALRCLLPFRSPIPTCLATCWHTMSLITPSVGLAGEKRVNRRKSLRVPCLLFQPHLLLGNETLEENPAALPVAPPQDPQQTLASQALIRYRTLPLSRRHDNRYVLRAVHDGAAKRSSWYTDTCTSHCKLKHAIYASSDT